MTTFHCTNGHDLCWQGPDEACPYCERRAEPSELIVRGALILYGRIWRADFCHTFQLNERRLRRMLAGTEDVPEGLLHDVETALRDHGTSLDELLSEFP